MARSSRKKAAAKKVVAPAKEAGGKPDAPGVKTRGENRATASERSTRSKLARGAKSSASGGKAGKGGPGKKAAKAGAGTKGGRAKATDETAETEAGAVEVLMNMSVPSPKPSPKPSSAAPAKSAAKSASKRAQMVWEQRQVTALLKAWDHWGVDEKQGSRDATRRTAGHAAEDVQKTVAEISGLGTSVTLEQCKSKMSAIASECRLYTSRRGTSRPLSGAARVEEQYQAKPPFYDEYMLSVGKNSAKQYKNKKGGPKTIRDSEATGGSSKFGTKHADDATVDERGVIHPTQCTASLKTNQLKKQFRILGESMVYKTGNGSHLVDRAKSRTRLNELLIVYWENKKTDKVGGVSEGRSGSSHL